MIIFFPACPAFIGAPGPTEMLVIGVIALLLFGKRLPEVARSLGKGIVEFKKGVQGIEEDVDGAAWANHDTASTRPAPAEDDPYEVTTPRFEPPQSPPTEHGDESESGTHAGA